MSSPIFRTQQIATLRYWSEVCNIIETNIYQNVGFTLDNSAQKFTLETTPYMFNLQSPRYTLQLPGTFEFSNESESKKFEVCT